MELNNQDEAKRLLEETPDLTEEERIYLNEVIEGKHSMLVWRCTFTNTLGAFYRIQS